jgi:ABC-type polysaccharide/polyol phosphate export permease
MYVISPKSCIPNKTVISSKNLDKQRIKQIVTSKIVADSGKYRLGLAWIALKPMLTASLYMFVLSVVRANSDGWSILVGIGLLTIYTSSFMRGLNVHSNFDSGIKIERIYSKIIILSNILFSCIQNAIQSLPIGTVLYLWTDSIELSISFLIIAQIFGFWSLGLGFFFSSFVKQTPDLIPFFSFINFALFFLSPVLFSLSDAPIDIISLSLYNPLTYFLEFSRCVYLTDWSIFYNVPTNPIIVFSCSIFISSMGFIFFDKTRWKVSSWS